MNVIVNILIMLAVIASIYLLIKNKRDKKNQGRKKPEGLNLHLEKVPSLKTLGKIPRKVDLEKVPPK